MCDNQIRLFYIKCTRCLAVLQVRRYLNTHKYRRIPTAVYGKNAWDRCACRARISDGKQRGANVIGEDPIRRCRIEHRECQVFREVYFRLQFHRVPVHPGAGRPVFLAIVARHAAHHRDVSTRPEIKMFIEPLERNHFPRV